MKVTGFRGPILLGMFAVVAYAGQAFGHPGHFVHPAHGFADGWAHPFHGIDHILAMLAVGLLAARAGGGALWLLPAVFLAGCAAGGLLAAAGVPGAGVEYAIALSVIAFGVLLALARGPALRWEAGIVTLFALFHGHAHVAELSGPASSHAAIGAGFLLASAVLIALGIAGGRLASRLAPSAVRLGGGAIAGAGAVLLAALLR